MESEDGQKVNQTVMMPEKVNLSEMFARFSSHWEPKIVGALNGQHVKVVKFKGSFVWHHHDVEDELFLVINGEFTMHFWGGSVVVKQGEFIIVPRGVDHRPEALDEVQVLLFEPATTVNTGSSPGAMTVENPEWL